jgi:DNA-directed RNA polymerase specialized sigma24 family protein
MRIAPTVSISEEQRKRLQSWARGRSTPMRSAQRAAMILRAAEGMSDRDIAVEHGCGRRTVARWRARFIERGIEGIARAALWT